MAAFAIADELATLLGRTFTADQETQADLILELATSAIAEAVDKDDDWAQALTPVPGGLKVLCLAVARRIMVNPDGARSTQEALGAYSHSESFNDTAATGLELTASERLRARRTVYGANTASVRVGSLIDDCVVHGHFQSIYIDGDENCS